MSKGIIVKQPSGGMPNGKISMIEGVNASADGRTNAIDAGTLISYGEVSPAQIGDLVDLTVENNAGKGLTVTKQGTVLTGVLTDNVEVAAGDVVVINAGTLDGKVSVNGGTLVLMGGTVIIGKVEAPVAGSVILVDNKCLIDGKLEVKTASIVSVRNSTVEGKLSTNGTNFTAVVTTVIRGKLEILNSKDCYTSGNTVDGKDDSGTCRH